jgi:hypothetical protein
MAPATRIDTLHTIYDLLRLAKPRERRSFPGQARMLEITEVAYVLQADGFPESAVFERLAQVYGTPPPPEPLDHLDEYLAEHLQTFDPAYLDLAAGCGLFGVALQVACLWAELHAGQVIHCGWPHQDQLRKAWDIDAYTGIIRTIPKGGRPKMKPFPTFTRSLADIDILLAEYRGEAAADVRRWKARAVPGDALHGFSTGGQSWRLMMGSSGIALVRDGRAIDYVVTRMN